MNSNKNKSLFWYGFRAKLKQIFGELLIGLSLTIGLISILFESYGVAFVCFILFCFGIWLICIGKSQRFDYKQQSGSMIHRGDW